MPRQSVFWNEAFAVAPERGAFTTITAVQNTFVAERSSYRNVTSRSPTLLGAKMCSATICRVRTCLAASRLASDLAVRTGKVAADAVEQHANAAAIASAPAFLVILTPSRTPSVRAQA